MVQEKDLVLHYKGGVYVVDNVHVDEIDYHSLWNGERFTRKRSEWEELTDDGTVRYQKLDGSQVRMLLAQFERLARRANPRSAEVTKMFSAVTRLQAKLAIVAPPPPAMTPEQRAAEALFARAYNLN